MRSNKIPKSRKFVISPNNTSILLLYIDSNPLFADVWQISDTRWSWLTTDQQLLGHLRSFISFTFFNASMRMSCILEDLTIKLPWTLEPFWAGSISQKVLPIRLLHYLFIYLFIYLVVLKLIYCQLTYISDSVALSWVWSGCSQSPIRTEHWTPIPHLTQTHLKEMIVKQHAKQTNTVLALIPGHKCYFCFCDVPVALLAFCTNLNPLS